MIDLLTYIAKSITGKDEIEITEEEVNGQKIYTIKTPKEVMGILIGKQGRTIHAIRLLARARAIKEQTSIRIELEEKS